MANQMTPERLIAALRAADALAWDWDADTGSMMAAGGLDNLLDLANGLSPADFIARVHAEDRQRVQEAFAKSAAYGVGHDVDCRLITTDGAVRWMNHRGKATLDESGNLRGLTGVLRDITEARWELEQASQARERCQILIDHLPQKVFVTNGDGAVRYFNARWTEFLGRDISEESVHRQMFHPDDFPMVVEKWRSCVAKREKFFMEYRLLRADGVYRWHLAIAEPLRSDSGEIVNWFGTCTDIEEQKQTEVALRRSNADLAQFAYVASHDLQEPLRTIASFSELLSREFSGKLTRQADQYLRWLLDAANRMSRLIRGLLTYCAVVNNPQEWEAAVDSQEAFSQARSDLGQIIAEKHAVVTADHLPVVRGNKMQLEQVFANLLGNALKYSKPGAAPRVHVSAKPHDSMYVFAVQDNGIGFHTSHSERIFGIFKRLHGLDVPGTGIGLAVCKAIIERHGGGIWAESNPGEGATFFFSLPAAPVNEAATTQPQ